MERLLRRHVGAEVLPGDPAEAPEAGHQQENPDDGQRRDRTARTSRGRRLLRIGEIIHQGLGHPAIVPASARRARLDSSSMSAAGWYPDPGNQPGAYRYWDGRGWTNQLTTNPGGAPAAPPTGPTGPLGAPGSAGPAPLPPGSPAKRSGRGWLIGLIAVAVVLVVLVVLAVRGLGGVLGGLPGVPGGDPSADVCPKPEASSTPTPQPNDGRVHSGPLSYPRLPVTVGAARSPIRRARSAATCCSSSSRPRRPPPSPGGPR